MIIAGRRKEVSDKTVAANPGIKGIVLDIESADSIQSFATLVSKDFPQLNALIHNAGIMKVEDLKSGQSTEAESMVATDLLGTIRLTAALLP